MIIPKKIYGSIIFILSALVIISCSNNKVSGSDREKIATTTEIISSIVSTIGSDFVSVSSIINYGNDPHTYKTNENDILRIAGSSIVIHSGYYLEGQLSELFDIKSSNKYLVSATSNISTDQLIKSNHTKFQYNPHFWHNINLYIQATQYITDLMISQAPFNERIYRQNEEIYMIRLLELKEELLKTFDSTPKENRKIASIHNAFEYLEAEYQYKTFYLQNISTEYVITRADINNFIDTLIKEDISVIFTETTTSPQIITRLEQTIDAVGANIKLIDMLYADTLVINSMGNLDYIQTMTHNANTITSALKNMTTNKTDNKSNTDKNSGNTNIKTNKKITPAKTRANTTKKKIITNTNKKKTAIAKTNTNTVKKKITTTTNKKKTVPAKTNTNVTKNKATTITDNETTIKPNNNIKKTDNNSITITNDNSSDISNTKK